MWDSSQNEIALAKSMHQELNTFIQNILTACIDVSAFDTHHLLRICDPLD